MNLFRRSTHSIYRTVAERLWTTSEGDEEGALGTSQQALNAKIAVKPVGQFRHRWRQMRSSTVLALVAVALCGILVCIYRKCGFKHMTDANLGGVAQQDQTSSDGGYVIPLTPSPIIGLLDGMAPLENNDYYPRVRSALGLVAERSYVQGPRTLDDYRSSLATFIDVAMPEDLRPTLQSGLTRYTSNRDSTLYLKNEYNRLAGVGEDPSTRRIWQINSSPDYTTSETAASWKNNGEGWEWKHLNDTGGSIYVREHLKGGRLSEVWNLVPNGCLRADMLRYLTLLLHGGIFSATDTKRIKPISQWENGTSLWQEGRGWLHADEEMARDGAHPRGNELGPPGLMIGIAVDVSEREDWQKVAKQPLQIAQWMIASTPYHPVILDAIRYMTHHAVESAEGKFRKLYIVQWLLVRGDKDMAKRMAQEKQKDVQIWTSTSSFTDAVLRYLRLKYDLHWSDLTNLTVPLRVGEVLILPVTGFSPGADLFGGKGVSDPQAMVEHLSKSENAKTR